MLRLKVALQEKHQSGFDHFVYSDDFRLADDWWAHSLPVGPVGLLQYAGELLIALG